MYSVRRRYHQRGREKIMVKSECIDRLKEIKAEMERLAAEKEALESEIIRSCEEELANTKYKTLSYRTKQGNCATVTLAESLKVIYPTMLKGIFGKAYADMVTEETRYTLSAPAKRLLTNICTGKYIRQGLDRAIRELPVSEEARTKLSKKLKGAKFDTDKKSLMNIGNMNAEDAAEYAYMITEAATWQQFEMLMKLNDITSEKDLSEILSQINSSMIVDESPKVSIA